MLLITQTEVLSLFPEVRAVDNRDNQLGRLKRQFDRASYNLKRLGKNCDVNRWVPQNPNFS